MAVAVFLDAVVEVVDAEDSVVVGADAVADAVSSVRTHVCNSTDCVMLSAGGGPGGRGGIAKRGGGDRGRGRGAPRGRGGRGGARGGGPRGGAKVILEPHRHPGIFIAKGKEQLLVTKNLVPGESVYGEKRISIDGGVDDTKVEYRVWNPFRSKLAAGILNGMDHVSIAPGKKVLYLGAASGTSVSHVADIVGPVRTTTLRRTPNLTAITGGSCVRGRIFAAVRA